ncbi:MAG: transcriptional regulator, ArsR family [Acidobacteria bacterium]|nr:transcriptional regulator, ArsR family [Acidobacteriota bacterium]
MRNLTAAALATLLLAGAAGAQLKMPKSAQPGARPGVAVAGSANGGLQTVPEQPLTSAKRITRDEASKLVASGKAVFVDVRSRETYDLDHIRGAISIPNSQMINRFKELPPGKMAITYCACQEEHTAAMSVLTLNAHGIKNAAALIGGWNEWKAARLPTQRTR